MKFPKEFDLPVDLKKVNWEVMKTWIAKRVTELLGIEDEVLIGYVYEQLENVKVAHSLKGLVFLVCQGPASLDCKESLSHHFGPVEANIRPQLHGCVYAEHSLLKYLLKHKF